MNHLSIFLRGLAITTLAIGLFFGSFAPDGFVSSATSEPNDQLISEQVQKSMGNLPVYFEENRGQQNGKVRYMTRGNSGASLFLTATEAVYVLQGPKSEVQSPKSNDLKTTIKDQSPKTADRALAVYMKLAGANANAEFAGDEQLEHRTNYFIGSDSSGWQTEIPNYRRVSVNGIYNGVDMIWQGKTGGEVQYDFVVEPNADPAQIEWRIEGARNVSIDADGSLLIETELGILRQGKPFSYQEAEGFRAEVESGYAVSGDLNGFSVKFNLSDYDRSKPLTIDPSVNLSNLAFSTFLGGGSDDLGRAVAVDSAGNVYVTGQTASPQFPTTAGTFDTSHNGSDDVFVTKLNAGGTTLIYSTFIGGSAVDVGTGIAIDSSGNAYLTGYTFSGVTDYPTTSTAFDTTHNGSFDVFVTKLNAGGSALIYSTFIGGSSTDLGNGIAIDLSGNAYLTGYTVDDVTDYPTTAGAFDTTHNGGVQDVFVTKLNAGGSALIYSTFIGGSSDDVGSGIAIDSSGNAYLTGFTFDAATDYPTTAGAFDTSHNGNYDVFVTKLNAGGSALIYSTFIGGSSDDVGSGIAVDSSGNAYLTGTTADGATDYPTTAGAFDTLHNGGPDVFVTKLNAGGSALIYSTFIGGNLTDQANGIAIDSSGSAYLTGRTLDALTAYPTTAGAFDTTHNGNYDVFVTKLNAGGSALIYSTFIGGSSTDQGNSIAIDSSGNAYLTGNTLDAATDYPTTPEAFQPTPNGSDDAFVTKFGDFAISGRTVDQAGLPIANVATAMSGSRSGFMLTDAQGYFSFTDTLVSGNFTVAATATLYNFTPNTFQLNGFNSNQELIFLGRPTTSGPTIAFANLGGDIESVAGNVPLPNTRLTLIDTGNGIVRQATTDAQGNYVFNNVRLGSFYLVFPEREGYNFTPGIYSLNYFEELANVDFVAAPNNPRPVQDFDGDGKTDLAVYRPSEGNWYILQSQNNSLKVVRFGVNGDIPVAEDYDGDRRSDVAVYRPSEGNWYRLNSSNGGFSAVHFGISEDTPVPADFDGDGKTDIAVYRPSSGVWHRLESSDGSYKAAQFGISSDRPVPADFDSDGKADLTVYRDGVWYQMNSSNGQVKIFQFGVAEDRPMAADFDGDGRTDVAVWRPSSGSWYWLNSSGGEFQARTFGISTDVPVPADYDGDGRFEQAVFRNGTWYVLRSNQSFYAAQFGQTGDIPISDR